MCRIHLQVYYSYLKTQLDCTIDGADEIETGTLACIKGGGGCLTQEKIIASCSEKLIIVADGAWVLE